jgi:hypothetical protein
LHIRFLPDSSTETDISSREFIKKAEFVNAESFAGSLEDESSNGGSGSGGGNHSGNTGGGGKNDDDDIITD